MQFKFFTALLLVGACLAQVAIAQSFLEIQQRSIVGDLIDQANRAIEKLTNLLAEKINDALRIFDRLKDEVIGLAENAIETAKDLVNSVISDARYQIKEIADKATGLGIDITVCILASEDQFRELLNDFVKEETECVQKEVDRAFQIINESIQIVADELATIQALPGKLQECGIGLSSIVCINRIILETAKLEIQLPLKIARKVAEVTNYVSGLQIRLEVCAASQIAAAGINSAIIVAEVGKCAADAIGGNMKY